MEPPTMLLVPICRDMQLWWDKPPIPSPRNRMPGDTCFDDVGRNCACVTWTQMYVTLQTKNVFHSKAVIIFFFKSASLLIFFRYSFQYSGLAGPWNRGIIAHQTPHFRRPPKHVNNKGPLVFAQTFCTAWFNSLENLHMYSKTYVFSNTFEGFRPKCTFRGCLSKYRRTFIVYMFRRPPEVWSLMSDNALISGTGKVGIEEIL